jgi:predicted lactoylglutathione lyase
MAGIVFLRTNSLVKTVDFYINTIGMNKWLSQTNVEILQHENLLLGFQEEEKAEYSDLVTFFYKTKEEVDAMYQKVKGHSLSEPEENDLYGIYNFFAKDPEGRIIEFQSFLHSLKPAGIDWIK